MTFQDRRDAGRQLAEALAEYKEKEDTIIMALPRGGVPVADEVAKVLKLPLDVWLVRKLGTPGQLELAMGAISIGDVIYLNKYVVDNAGISEDDIESAVEREKAELERRNILYRAGKPAPDIKGKTIIIVDDGLATGSTMQAAAQSLKKAGAGYIVVAVPVCSDTGFDILSDVSDKIICLHKPDFFMAVGQWYSDFSQTTDEEVQSILNKRPA